MQTAKRTRGRPKDDTKRTALLDAARSLFLARGTDVTIDEVAATAGVSKATLYANFADKDSLIAAVIRRESDNTITDEEYSRFTQSRISDVLFSFGVRFVSFINNRDILGWDRLIAVLETRHSELPKRFFDLGPGRGQRLLTALIARAINQGHLKAVDADYAADALTGLWLGFTTLEIKLGARPPLTDEEIKQRVERGISIFMAVYGAETENLTDQPP
ncbi:TetR family transcriptional regulator [Neoroseomonas lacus]|uniref:TetR family transcriptional regulator n=1 Tax=Neoroseomonas lacus TaxID=287609 RepID=A0A917NSL6_9PROT|nr:TetR family transcriptional regulator [Neoroseomonas lacus]